MIDRNCIVCGSFFQVKPHEVKRGKGKSCSYACSAILATAKRRSYKSELNPNWKGEKCSKKALYGRKYGLDHPLKRKAHIMVKTALRNGFLKKYPCVVCGIQKTEAHHDDYNKPLDVRWLCSKHHKEVHKKLNAEAGVASRPAQFNFE